MIEKEKATQWFVLKTKAHKELKVADFLNQRGFEVYVPKKVVIRQWSDRKKKVLQAIIPNYIFINTSEIERLQVFPCRDIINYLFWQGKVVTMRDSEMLKMKKWFNDHENENIKSKELSAGSHIRIQSGVLMGKTGVVEKMNKSFIDINIDGGDIKIQLERKTEIELV